MQKRTISWKVSILINAPRTEVWDFTQNYECRMQWDKSVLEADVLRTIPAREVMLKIKPVLPIRKVCLADSFIETYFNTFSASLSLYGFFMGCIPLDR